MKKILVLLAALSIGVFVTACGNNAIPEDQYLSMLEKSKDVGDEKVTVKIKKIADTGDVFGWCAYGEDGGLWMSENAPSFLEGDTVTLSPNKAERLFGNWAIWYTR